MDRSRNTRDVVAAIIAMARHLDLRTIAERVETAEETAALRTMGCDEAQDFYFTLPMPLDQRVQLAGSLPVVRERERSS